MGVPTAQLSSRTDAVLASELRLSVVRLRRRLAAERDPDNELSVTAMAVLGALHRDGELTVGELAGRERVQPPSMTRTLTLLAAAGHVVRRPDAADRRLVRVCLTDTGRATLLADRRRRDEWLTRCLHELTPDERAALRVAAPLLARLARKD
ncbi:MAG: MarR family transcriptional regulator [Nocardioides sp.]|nr:MarR family transcriptional regulator [Nocardioides sp.]